MRQTFFSLTDYGNILPNETRISFIGSEELDWLLKSIRLFVLLGC